MWFKFIFKTGGVCDHLKFTWETVPLCWTAERKLLYAVQVSGSRAGWLNANQIDDSCLPTSSLVQRGVTDIVQHGSDVQAGTGTV